MGFLAPQTAALIGDQNGGLASLQGQLSQSHIPPPLKATGEPTCVLRVWVSACLFPECLKIRKLADCSSGRHLVSGKETGEGSGSGDRG